MPGILGIVTKLPRERAQSELRRMLDSMVHEKFYRCGIWSSEVLGIYTGWVAPEDAAYETPLQDESGRRALIFCGEEYSEGNQAGRLSQAGENEHRFLAGLNGRFHGLVVDHTRGIATLFNDRYGLHRVYYHEGKEAFYFAAEAKAILAVRPELKGLDSRSLGEFLSCGCVLEDRTLFPGISVLPPGSAWRFRNGASDSKRSYFDPSEWERQEALAPEVFYTQLRSAFRQCLPSYLRGARVAMSLTGGYDTRIVMAWARPARGALPCYTFAGTFRDSQDVRVARKVAAACEQSHETIRVGDEFLSRFADHAERTVFLTDGCVSVQHTPDLYVNQLARQIAPVRITGNYGSEVLRGVRAFKPGTPMPGLFAEDIVPHLTQAQKTYDGLLREHPLTFAAFRQAPWHHYGLLALEQTQLTLRSPFLDNELLRTLYRAPRHALGDEGLSRRLVRDGNPLLDRIATDRGGGHDILSFVRNGFHRFTFKTEYAYNHGMPQWLARVDHRLRPLHLERLFLGRHKFTHFRVWYRDRLASYVREMLLDHKTLSRPWIKRHKLEEIVTGHLKGDRNYTTEIHKVLTLELLHRTLLENPAGN